MCWERKKLEALVIYRQVSRQSGDAVDLHVIRFANLTLWRSGGSTPWTAGQQKAVHAAATPYYTPAQVGTSFGAAATPVDAWYSIISSLKGTSAGKAASRSSSRVLTEVLHMLQVLQPGTLIDVLCTAAPAHTSVTVLSSIIRCIFFHAGAHGSPAAHIRRGPNSPGGSSYAGSPASIRQQLFQTAAKSSRQG